MNWLKMDDFQIGSRVRFRFEEKNYDTEFSYVDPRGRFFEVWHKNLRGVQFNLGEFNRLPLRHSRRTRRPEGNPESVRVTGDRRYVQKKPGTVGTRQIRPEWVWRVRHKYTFTPHLRNKYPSVLDIQLLIDLDRRGEITQGVRLTKGEYHDLFEQHAWILGIQNYLGSYIPMTIWLRTGIEELQRTGKTTDRIDVMFINGTIEFGIDLIHSALYPTDSGVKFSDLLRPQGAQDHEIPCGTVFDIGFDPDSDGTTLYMAPRLLPMPQVISGLVLDADADGNVTWCSQSREIHYETDGQVLWLSENYLFHGNEVLKQARRVGHGFRDIVMETLVNELKATDRFVHWREVYESVYRKRICPMSTVLYVLYDCENRRTLLGEQWWKLERRQGMFKAVAVESPPEVSRVSARETRNRIGEAGSGNGEVARGVHSGTEGGSNNIADKPLLHPNRVPLWRKVLLWVRSLWKRITRTASSSGGPSQLSVSP